MIQPIFIGNVAGLSHAKPDLSCMSPSQQVHLIHEPTNEFDPRAIKVIHPAAGKLGYIPKESTEIFHRAWDNGFEPETKIRSIEPGARFDKVILVSSLTLDPTQLSIS